MSTNYNHKFLEVFEDRIPLIEAGMNELRAALPNVYSFREMSDLLTLHREALLCARLLSFDKGNLRRYSHALNLWHNRNNIHRIDYAAYKFDANHVFGKVIIKHDLCTVRRDLVQEIFESIQNALGHCSFGYREWKDIKYSMGGHTNIKVIHYPNIATMLRLAGCEDGDSLENFE